MRNLRLFIIAGFLPVVFSCNRDAVKLVFTNARDEVPMLVNFTFRFNKPLIRDSLLNLWDSTEYISFEPAIPGRFRWESPDQLVFSPAAPLSPATTYKAKISREVLRYSKYGFVEGGEDIRFHTPDLLLDNLQASWSLLDENTRTAVPQLDLYFNYAVNPAELQSKLTVMVDDQKADITAVTQNPGDRVSFRINGLKVADKDYSTRVLIDKGLKPDRGSNATAEAIEQKFYIPSPYVLRIQHVESEHDGSEGIIRVTTSQQLVNENLKASVKIVPQIGFSAEADETGLLIRSDKFDVEKSYTITFMQGMKGKLGGTLKEDYSEQVAFGQLSPEISFTNNKAVYLSKKGSKNVEVKIVNVPKVKLVISKVYENNLLLAQRYDYSPQENQRSSTRYAVYGDDEGEYYYDDYYYDSYSDVTLGDVIYEKEIDTRSLPQSGGGRVLNLADYEDRLPEFNGIYHVVIRSTDRYWLRDSRFISLSDIGVIAREGADKLYVFTNSIKTAGALNGVNILVYGSNNQLLGRASTNEEGVAEVEYVKKEFSGFRPAMIIAKTGNDFNYLPFNSTRVNTSRFEVGGKRTNSTGLDAFIYAERDIYRPGEKIHYSVIVRDRQWNVPGDLLLKLKFLLPNGKELKSIRKSLNEQGSMEGDIDLSASAITGSYSLEVYTSNDILLAASSFNVEEFVPDRIRVNARLDKDFLRVGEQATLNINAMNFFGPPAANRSYEMEVQVSRKYFSPEKYPDYDFNLSNMTTLFDKTFREGTTDGDGNAVENYSLPATLKNSGLLAARFYTTVFDETGRPVSRSASLDLFTQDVLLGVKRDGYYYQPLNKPARFFITAVNKDGNTVKAKAKVQVVKHEYHTNLVRSGSYFRYESEKEDKSMFENEMNVGEGTPFSYIPKTPGDYELRVYVPGSDTYISKSFYSYGSWGYNYSSFEVNNEGNIEIKPEKKSYYTGEAARVLFTTPFDGRMLVTMETDKVVFYKYVDVENRSAQIDLPVSAGHLPNVYITATIIKPHEVTDMPLVVAHGFQNIKVEEKNRKIPVEIVAEKKVRSRTKQKVRVKAEPGSYITLAAVDNGVLQVSSFDTPDPYDHFYEKRALQVTAYDLYPLLFPEIRARLSSTGGDGDLEMNKRVNPVQAKRVKILSYWSGIARSNANGEAAFDIDIPQFSGEVRLMAVAYKDQHFGSAENTMTVADPIVISTALPRFLSPGDTILVPVTISNTTAKSAGISAVIKTDGPVKIVSEAKQTASVNGNSETRAVFRVVAEPVLAAGHVNIEVSAMGEKFTEKTEIAVRPASPLLKVTDNGSIKAGTTRQLTIGLSDFIPSSTGYKLVVSRSPVVEMGKHFSYLVQYPYGCTEQTVSAAFPQLYFGDLADAMGLNPVQQQNANFNILEAIRKIKMRQLYNGAVTLWDGSGEAHWWATVYAAHFLLEARKAGFIVDNSLLETMLGYLGDQLKSRRTITYYYNRTLNKKIAPKEVAYSLYVLALAGRPSVPSMNYYKANPELLALDSKYLLSAAYAMAGDKRSFSGMLPGSFAGEESVAQTGGSFYSDVRDEAIALNALVEVDPGNSQVGVMARHVRDKLNSRQWLSTQERSFAFLALGKLARAAAKSDVTAEIKVGGRTVASVGANPWKGDNQVLKGNTVEIQTKGTGQLYYFWESEGISAGGNYKEEDNFMRVRKRFYDRNGKEIYGNTFKQNDLIIIGITLEKAYSGRIDNVVITDLLPAGFEIENPRTKEIPGMDWIKDSFSPTSLDARDDRIHFFVDLYNLKQTYYYAVRAVSPGRFKMGPVSADAMYNGEYHSYNGAGTIKVE